jgi:Replication-relaxation
VNEFFVRLAVEARAAGGALREWYGERTTQRLLDGIAAPDGYGVIALPDRNPLHLLLELDRGTEPLRRIREKVDRYAKAIPRSELADAEPLVLFLAPTVTRTEHIERALGIAGQARTNPIRCQARCWQQTSGKSVLLGLSCRPGQGVAS